MRIADRVEMLEMTTEQGPLHPVLLWDEKQVVLVDTGLPGQMDMLEQQMAKAGFSPRQVTKVILTHQDLDHIGCAKQLAQLGAEILAHKAEAPYIQGDETPVKIAAMEARLPELTEGERDFYERVKTGASLFQLPVNRLLEEGETLDFCGGMEVMATPGHTPGHISLFLRGPGVLLAGDAANIKEGKLTGADPHYSHDIEKAQLSFQKIVEAGPGVVVCYHGGLYRP